VFVEREEASSVLLRGTSRDDDTELGAVLVSVAKRAGLHHPHAAETVTVSQTAAGAAELRFRVPLGKPLREVGVGARLLPRVGIAMIEVMSVLRAAGVDPGPIDSDMIWLTDDEVPVAHQLGVAGRMRVFDENLKGPSLERVPLRTSPEAAADQVTDGRTDVFHVAWLMFELRTGYEPFPRDDRSTFLQALTTSKFGDPAELGAAEPLAHLLRLGLSHKRALRPSPKAFAAGLRALRPNGV
jgi:hypothetical protein